MKVTAVETLRLGEFPNLIWVRVHTDEGVTGLGETFFGAEAVEAYIHESVAPYLLGKDPLHIDKHARALTPYVGYRLRRRRGARQLGDRHRPLGPLRALGRPADLSTAGRTQPGAHPHLQHLRRLPLRAGPAEAGGRQLGSAGDGGGRGTVRGPRRLPAPRRRAGAEPARAGHHRHEDLAVRPLRRGERRPRHLRRAISTAALEPFRKIRAAVGLEMDIMVEFHGLWNLPTARRIARALEEFEPYWFEDPLRADNIDALATFAAGTHVPVTLSETIATRWGFREVVRARRGGDRHARHLLVRRHLGGEEDRHHGRGATSCRWRRTTAPDRSS